jgi:hypothetical protein
MINNEDWATLRFWKRIALIAIICITIGGLLGFACLRFFITF